MNKTKSIIYGDYIDNDKSAFFYVVNYPIEINGRLVSNLEAEYRLNKFGMLPEDTIRIPEVSWLMLQKDMNQVAYTRDNLLLLLRQYKDITVRLYEMEKMYKAAPREIDMKFYKELLERQEEIVNRILKERDKDE